MYGKLFYHKLLIYQIYEKNDWKKWGCYSNNKLMNLWGKGLLLLGGPIVCIIASDLEPDNKHFFYNIANAYNKLEEYESALKYYLKMILSERELTELLIL